MLLVNIATFEDILTLAWIVFYKLTLNTLSAKVCFLKLKTDTPLASNLLKTALSFLHPQAKLKNLFSLLLKLILNKFNISINLMA